MLAEYSVGLRARGPMELVNLENVVEVRARAFTQPEFKNSQ